MSDVPPAALGAWKRCLRTDSGNVAYVSLGGLKVLGPRSEAKGVGSKAGAVSRHHLHVSEAAISKLGNGARLLGEAAHELDRYGGGRTELEVCLGVSGVSLF